MVILGLRELLRRRFVYVPFSLGARPIDPLSLGLTLPYIYQSSENVVVTRDSRQRPRSRYWRVAAQSASISAGDSWIVCFATPSAGASTPPTC